MKKSKMLIGVWCLAGCLGLSGAWADTATWVAVDAEELGDGDWGAASSWSTGVVPGSGDTASFDTSVSDTVAVLESADQTIGELSVTTGSLGITNENSYSLTLDSVNIGAQNTDLIIFVPTIFTGDADLTITGGVGGVFVTFFGTVTTGTGAMTLTLSGTNDVPSTVTFESDTDFTSASVPTNTYVHFGSASGVPTDSLAVDGAVDFFDASETITADVTGSGELNWQDGDYVFTGSATHTGGTTVLESASLTLGDGGTSGSISGDITNDGSVVFGRSDVAEYSGVISGSGSVEQMGAGVTTLSGTNTFTGGLTLTGGIVIFSEDGNLGDSSGGVTMAGGTLSSTGTWQNGRTITGNGTISTAFVGTSASSVSASGGSLTIGDSALAIGFVTDGTLATNDQQVTLLSAGAAVLGSSTTLGNADGNGTLISANGFVLGADGTLSGAGTVENGNSADTAFTNNGTVDGTGSGTADELEFTGYVTGSGTFTGDVAFSGTYAPGSSPGTVALENFRLSSTSALEIDLAGTTRGVMYDFLDISGTATLEGGTLSVVLLDGFVPSYGDTFTFMEADGGIIGDFGSFDLPTLSGGLSWSVSNDGTFYSITAVPEPGEIGWVIGFGLAGVALARRLANPSPRRREDG